MLVSVSCMSINWRHIVGGVSSAKHARIIIALVRSRFVGVTTDVSLVRTRPWCVFICSQRILERDAVEKWAHNIEKRGLFLVASWIVRDARQFDSTKHLFDAV